MLLRNRAALGDESLSYRGRNALLTKATPSLLTAGTCFVPGEMRGAPICTSEMDFETKTDSCGAIKTSSNDTPIPDSGNTRLLLALIQETAIQESYLDAAVTV
ncbi:unnamed protein product [Sphagnum tenellum]